MAVRAVIATSCHTTGFKTKQSFTWMAFSDRFGSEEETGTVLHVVWHVSVSVRVPVGDGVRHCFMVFLLFLKKHAFTLRLVTVATFSLWEKRTTRSVQLLLSTRRVT